MNGTTLFFALLLVSCRYTHCLDYIWNAPLGSDGLWATADNWLPVGVPGATDNASFTQSNVSALVLQPVSVRNLRIAIDVNVTFTNALTISGTLRLANGILFVGGDFTVEGTVDLAAGSIEASSVVFFNTLTWQSGELTFVTEPATINTFTITGTSGLLIGSFNILQALNLIDGSRYFQESIITISSNATFFISSNTQSLMQLIPLTNCQIINNGFLHGVFALLDQSGSTLVRFDNPGTSSTVTLENNGDMLLEGNGFLEVSVISQRSGSLNLLSYSTQEVGLRTRPNTVFYVYGGYISGNGYIDTEVWMYGNTALYLSATSNVTISRVNFAGNALLQITFFDSAIHGILLTSAVNPRSGTGGILQLVYGNGPNALLSSVPSTYASINSRSRTTRVARIKDSASTLQAGLAHNARSSPPLLGLAEHTGNKRSARQVEDVVVPIVNNGTDGGGSNMLLPSNREVNVGVGDLFLLIAPLQFTNPLPTPNLLQVQVENGKFELEPTGVQWATSPTSSIIFYNVTAVSCQNQCSFNGDCVYTSPDTNGVCACNPSSDRLHSDCSVVSYAFLSWIIAPAIFLFFLLIEITYCFAEHRSRRQIIKDPASYLNIRPEVSAYRTVHRKRGVKRSAFDMATLFLFTTEIEGAARSYDMLSKIILTLSSVAIGLLSIIPFTGNNKALQQVFVGINAGLIFTLAVIQLAWTSLKPRKVEFDVEVDDKKVSLWAPFNIETLSWLNRAVPLEMNRLYQPPVPYKIDEFAFVDQSLDLNMTIRDYFSQYYRMPKMYCIRNISTNPVVNSPSAPPIPTSPSAVMAPNSPSAPAAQ